MLTNFKVIESEGVDIDGNDLWVQSYVVSTSNDSARGWMDYENGVAQEVSANKKAIFCKKSCNLTLTNRTSLRSEFRSEIFYGLSEVLCSVLQNGSKRRKIPLFFSAKEKSS